MKPLYFLSLVTLSVPQDTLATLFKENPFQNVVSGTSISGVGLWSTFTTLHYSTYIYTVNAHDLFLCPYSLQVECGAAQGHRASVLGGNRTGQHLQHHTACDYQSSRGGTESTDISRTTW